MNRTAYSIRASFTPPVIARREYMPRLVAQQVPVTRTIAHHGTRAVSYRVTRMVPHTETRKVAVNTIRYVAQEVVQTRPVTVWRTVPIGSTMAYSVSPMAPQTVLAPQPDPVGSAKQPPKGRTANSGDNKFNNQPAEGNGQKFQRDSSRGNTDKPDGFGIRRPFRHSAADTTGQVVGRFVRPARAPGVVRAGRWISRRQRLESAGPKLSSPQVVAASSPRN
ncbi:MAG: hypothetical protein D6800_08090 [Candidatus Zixiibacteriota bacterium]|nr:MAG: hypothetical protein D6800_08090 [candidate division Zixibacteria bacterium]